MKVFDAHLHYQPWKMLKPEVLKAMSRGDNFDFLMSLMYDTKKFLNYLDKECVEKVCIINYSSPDIMGFTDEVNDFAVQCAKSAPDRIIPFGSIHPLHTKNPQKAMDRIISQGIKGIKMHSVHQLVYPNAYKDGMKSLEIIYKKSQDAGIPVMFHTGTSVFKGARGKYGDPIYIDDVAVDFPNLKIIIAHGGRPIWMQTAIYLIRRFKNVYMDISSIPPQNLLDYFPKLEKLADKVLWGSDWPGPGIGDLKSGIEKFAALPISEEAKKNIFWNNATKLFA